MFSIGISSAAYIAASVLFILSLGGLSNQESAKRAVWFGIVGMAIAVVATVFGPGVHNIFLILIAIAAGGFAGYYIAGKVQMTEMPQLVAALHSFVGLASSVPSERHNSQPPMTKSPTSYPGPAAPK